MSPDHALARLTPRSSAQPIWYCNGERNSRQTRKYTEPKTQSEDIDAGLRRTHSIRPPHRRKPIGYMSEERVRSEDRGLHEDFTAGAHHDLNRASETNPTRLRKASVQTISVAIHTTRQGPRGTSSNHDELGGITVPEGRSPGKRPKLSRNWGATPRT